MVAVKKTESTKRIESLFDFAWFPDWDGCLAELAEMAMKENWDYSNAPTGKFPILRNYLVHTFLRLLEEKKVHIVPKQYAIFNTWLVTTRQQEIYVLFTPNKMPGKMRWYFAWFKIESDTELLKINPLPQMAHYFNNPIDLVYDTALELRVNIEHIISDNEDRFPPDLLANKFMLQNILQAAIENAKKRVRRNYRTAVPQYFNGKLQLLLPLCLLSEDKADLAIVIERVDNLYRATTCLTLDMAVNNARLIARPDNEWLDL